MAARYWVGGTASWDGTAGTKWAATSGGTGGASVPTSADDVYFDANSGASTVTIATGNTGAKSITCTGFTGAITGSADISVAGSVTLDAGMTWSHSGTKTFTAAATLTTAGKTFGHTTINAPGATVQLADATTLGTTVGAGLLTITAGTFQTNNYTMTINSLVRSGSATAVVNLGASTITANGNGFDFSSSTNLTVNAGTSQLNMSGGLPTFFGGGLTYYNVAFTGTSATFSRAVSGSSIFNDLSVSGPSSAGVVRVLFNSPQTINGTLSTTGTAGNRRVWFQSSTYGIAQTLTVNATSLTDADFRDLYIVGTAAPISGTRIGDLRGCKGITFSTPKTVYWNLAGTNNWNANAWATTPTGTPSTDNFPLAQDTATFTNAGAITQVSAFNFTGDYVGTVDMSGRTSAMTIQISNAGTVYGDWINGSGTTITNAVAITFSGRNTQTITSAGKTFSGGITIDSYGGSVELADALNIGTQTLTVTNGTFDTKNYNVTAGALSSSNSNVRTITLGSSTLTFSGSTPIDFSTNTNLTFNAGTSQINASATSLTLTGASSASNGVTFYNVSFTSTSSVASGITGVNTFNNLTISAPASAGIVGISLTANQTITGTLTVAGASPVRRVFVRSNAFGTPRTLTVGTLSATDCDFRDITIAGTSAGSSPTRAGDCGGNSGITFPAPKTVYWNLAGTQNWSATGWCTGSGGTPDINQFPLAQDTAVFDNTGAAGTITINQAWNIGTFDASARTSAMTLTTSSNAPFVYGDWKFGTGVTSSSTTGTITFAKRGTQTITSNGVQFGCPVTVNNVTGIVQLADALSLGSARTLGLGFGSFDASGYNVTAGLINGSDSSVRTVKMGSGTWTASGIGTVWNFATTTGLAFYKGTANIVLSDTSTSARTFDGGGLSYNKLTIGGTTGTSTLTITGNNQFTELASTKTVAHTIALGTTAQTFGKWTVTGTAGNVVTLTGTGTGHLIAGAATSGIDYLAMGSIGFSAASPGEFYAGANSTGTAAAPVFRTAPPTPRTLYWVGGTGNWSDTARWSTSSGGGGGAAVPTSLDDVIFDSASNATAYTATVDANTRFKSLTIAGPASGNVTLAGSSFLFAHGNVTLPATGLTRTYTGVLTLTGSAGGKTLTTNGVALAGQVRVDGVNCAWALGSALDMGSSAFTLTNGSFDLAGYNLTAGTFSSDNGNSRTIDFDTGTTTLSGSIAIFFGTTETNRANLTVTAGTSQINCSNGSATLTGNNQTFYNVSFTSASAGVPAINGANSFNNLSFAGLTGIGLKQIPLSANQTVTGTLTFSAGTNAAMRHFVRSDTIGTTRTITAAAFSGTDVDFRDITITGAAAPVSGTRLGDCKGNSGITFPSPKTVYCRATTSANWSTSTSWAATDGGTADITQFPLAQDTAVLSATYPNSGTTFTIDGSYNIGTIDMSARTTNTVTLATGSNTPTIYGNWINGAGTTLTSTGTITFAGRGSQTITSAGKTFTNQLEINSPGGTVSLLDAFTCDRAASTGAVILTAGSFSDGGYNLTLTSTANNAGFLSSNSNTRSLSINGVWTIAAASSSNVWNTGTSTNLTVTGTGTIRLNSASDKTFAGGGISYTNITLDQAGAGTLTISGNNTFKDITNSRRFAGAATINIGTTTQRVSQWSASGSIGNILTVTGTSASSPGTLIYTGAGTATASSVNYMTITGVRAYSLTDTWYAGANSTNNGSLGWYFEGGTASLATGNFFLLLGS